MKKITQIISLTLTVGLFIGFTACGKKNPNSPGVEFMPDMYRSPSLEANMAYVKLNDGKETGDTLQANRMPVEGTISRGHMPYLFPNTADGYAASDANKNPLSATDANLKEGEVLYGKFCTHCHGAGGEADGKVAAKLPGPPPAYSTLKNLSEGKMYHSITYGKGLMGSHASQLSPEERWKLVLYIKKLQFPNGMEVVGDSTATSKKTDKKN